MITDLTEKYNISKEDIKSYASYCLNPKDDENINERLVGFWTNSVNIDVNEPDQTVKFAEEICAWNKKMKAGRALGKNTRNAILGSVAFSPKDDITPEEAIAHVQKVITRLMPGRRPMMLAVHHDTEHMHVHFIVATVNLEGEYYNPTGKYRAMFDEWELEMERTEVENNLIRVKSRFAMEKEDPTRTVNVRATPSIELQKTVRTGEATPDMVLKKRVIDAFEDNLGDFDGFLDDLRDNDVRVIPNISLESGKCSGLSFALQQGDMEYAIKGSKIGKKFAWNNITKEMNYEQNRHSQQLIELRRATPSVDTCRNSKERDRKNDAIDNSSIDGQSPPTVQPTNTDQHTDFTSGNGEGEIIGTGESTVSNNSNGGGDHNNNKGDHSTGDKRRNEGAIQFLKRSRLERQHNNNQHNGQDREEERNPTPTNKRTGRTDDDGFKPNNRTVGEIRSTIEPNKNSIDSGNNGNSPWIHGTHALRNENPTITVSPSDISTAWTEAALTWKKDLKKKRAEYAKQQAQEQKEQSQDFTVDCSPLANTNQEISSNQEEEQQHLTYGDEYDFK